MFEYSIPEENHRGTSQGSGAVHENPSATTASESGCGAAFKLAPGERRTRRRAMISAPVRVRSLDVTQPGPHEITTTLDVSRGGLLFVSSLGTFEQGMEVAVTFPYSKVPGAVQAEQVGRVARVSQGVDGSYSVAVVLGVGVGVDLVDSCGRKFVEAAEPVANAPERDTKRPFVLVVDAESAIRDSLKTYLDGEGYDVIAVGTAAEAHEVLKMFTPVLLIAEIEGEDLPGFELCAHVKSTPRLQSIPVMLLTSSAYPSDYANAHSLGAVVCMAKPYRQERLGHVVRLLAPTAQAKRQTAPPRPADLKRKMRAKGGKNPGGIMMLPNRPGSDW
jgi:CheY-like chemotaxis protein